MRKRFRIASIASEVSPYSKTGGLADVTKALSKALAGFGYQVFLITPYYNFIKKQGLNLQKVPASTIISVGKQKYSVNFYRLNFNDNLKIYFIANDKLFGKRSKVYGYPDDNLRFLIFNLAALKLLELRSIKPQVIHCHDWQAGLVPYFLTKNASRYPSLKKTATVFTIHNLTFQSADNWWVQSNKGKNEYRQDPLKNTGFIKRINFTKRAIFYSDIINTVSERYAEEITTPEFGQGLDKYLRRRKKDLHGIINGIDYTVHNPAYDNNIIFKYDWNSLRRKKKNKLELQKIIGLEKNPDIPLIGIVNRLTEQKGFSLIMETIDILMRLPLQIVIVGEGFKEYVMFFKKMAKKFPKKIGIYTPFREEMESKVYAGSDMFLMPSRFEPCGISQLKSLRYGSIPIVHETGGLSDTITNFNPKTRKGNGFVFKKYTKEDFLIALTRALENYKYTQIWEYLTWRAMQQSYSWELPAKKYFKLYNLAIKQRQQKKPPYIN
ncbi:glycogen synthase [Patescibacteria group bacterium]|nr:glycogen synthase [Patescibacteria group bacterium]MBU0964463.1 glycogen synthase [Patescibacteria group bacterium]